MDFFAVLLIGLGLSADCFAVAISGSVSMGSALDHSKRIKVAGYFGFFQFAMLIAGFAVGSSVVGLIESFDHWVAFILLVFIGARMIKESFETGNSNREAFDISQVKTLLGLSVATSIDALAVGLTFAFVKVAIIPAALFVGIVCFCVSLAGFLIGKRLGNLIGKRAELLGGLVLIGIGVKTLFEGLNA